MSNWTVSTMYARFLEVIEEEDIEVDDDTTTLGEIKDIIRDRIVKDAMKRRNA